MAIRPTSGGLTAEEKRVVKRLLSRKWRNQDIQALINTGRVVTINSARTTEVKQNDRQRLATDDETDFFISKKHSYDPITGLNLYDDCPSSYKMARISARAKRDLAHLFG